jgi:predicted exporter
MDDALVLKEELRDGVWVVHDPRRQVIHASSH